MKKSDQIKLFRSIDPYCSEKMKAWGFSHLNGLRYVRFLSPELYNRIDFEWITGGRDRFFAVVAIGSLKNVVCDMQDGIIINVDFFRVDFKCLFASTLSGQKRGLNIDPPAYDFTDPLPYLKWLFEDVHEVWHEWFNRFSTLEAILTWLLGGGDIWGLDWINKIAPVNLRRAAYIMANAGANEKAIELLEEYYTRIDVHNPGYIKLYPSRYKCEMQLLDDLKNGKKVTMSDYKIV